MFALRVVAIAERLVKLAVLATFLCVLLEASARVVIFGAAGLGPRKARPFQDLSPSSLVRSEIDRRMLFEYRPKPDVFFLSAGRGGSGRERMAIRASTGRFA